MNPLTGDLQLLGWDSSYGKDELSNLHNHYESMTEEKLWENLQYFLQSIIKVADETGTKMAIHPDDPLWSIFELPRIITSKENLERFTQLVESPNNGLTICTGSLGANPNKDLPEIIRYFGQKGLIHFAHIRNIKITGYHSFHETSHRSSDGSLDIVEIMKAYDDIGFDGPIRPDHGRMIWGEKGRPGYGLFDRALGAVYLNAIWDTLKKTKMKGEVFQIENPVSGWKSCRH
ncbi:mannonate dehydratase [Cytobacillus oceanisediminis]|uniref:Mannonate dehydratase n=1 Tax=Cytobacillus oceanisediminis TaxID=665099 RepID=A0A2V2ZV12_9BACI|nr:mannonate dehydratase [Cytobacillus oceanisediminis]